MNIKYKLVAFIVLLILGFFVFNGYIYNEKQGDNFVEANYKDIRFNIDGDLIKLENGFSKVDTAPGSATKIITRYFGNEVEGDLNGDGLKDKVFLLTQESGGSGTFFYVVVAIKKGSGYVGSSAYFLGDRIAPQNTEIRDGEIIVNYAKRGESEPMSNSPSIGVSLRLILEGRSLIEIKNE